MILTVTPNPALDLTWHVDSLRIGDTHRAGTGVARAGGKGLNVARVAHAQDADTLAITTVGGGTGEEFAAELGASGVPNRLLPVTAATRRSIAIVDEKLGDTTIINERGLTPSATEWEALHAAVGAAVPAARVLVISGSMPPGAADDELPRLIRAGRDAGAIVIVDTSGAAMLRAADAGASVLKPNAAELAEATGIADPIEGARVLLDRGASLVLLSRGAEGMLAITASSSASAADRHGAEPLSILQARLPHPLAGNPTGAGDAAVAACAVLLDAGVDDPEKILRRATAWSAAAVLMPLAGEIHASWPDLERAVEIGPPRVEPAFPARDSASDAMSHAAEPGSPPHPPERLDPKDPA